MKQPTQFIPANPHGGANPLRITGLMNVCNMMRIKVAKDGNKKVVFRQPDLLGVDFQDLEVPYIQVPQTPAPNDVNPSTIEIYYFCRRHMVQLSVYGRLLVKTKGFADDEVAFETANVMSVEERELDIKLNDSAYQKGRWPYKTRTALFGACVRKYRDEKYSVTQIARMLWVTEALVRICLSGKAMVHSDSTALRQTRSSLQDHPNYVAIKKQVEAARVKAYNSKPRVAADFTVSDALPTVYDVQGNSGSHNSDWVVPKLCPVLRIPLDYNVLKREKEERISPYVVRVWRKTPGPDGTAPLDKDNVSIMSRKAAMIIEGAQVTSVLKHLNDDERTALAEWQAKYGTRTVPRETRIGRPPKGINHG